MSLKWSGKQLPLEKAISILYQSLYPAATLSQTIDILIIPSVFGDVETP